MGRGLAALTAAFLLMSSAHAAESTRPRLVRDIRPGESAGIDPIFSGRREGGAFPSLRDEIFFWASDGKHGSELWKTDGTRAGTRMVRDIRPGRRSGRVFTSTLLVEAGGRLFFIANDGRSGAELWTSDGTRRGTHLVRDIAPGEESSSTEALAPFGRILLFGARTEAAGLELWRSNGKRAGTTLVKDIAPGERDSFPAGITEMNGTAYFSGEHPEFGRELWRSDGTRTGTTLVKDINPGAVGWSSPEGLTKVGRTLFFNAAHETCCEAIGVPNTTRNAELWKSDGTGKGTVLVKDIHTGPRDSSPHGFTAFGDIVLFSAFDPLRGRELWRSDGTPDGTLLVEDIFPGPHPNTCLPPVLGCFDSVTGLTPTGDVTFFTATHSPEGPELWKTDGTEAGTEVVENIWPGPLQGALPHELARIGKTLYFGAEDPSLGVEPWCSRGKAETTGVIDDVNDGSGPSYPFGFTKIGDKLLFVADDGDHGWELHVLKLGRAGSTASCR